MTQALDELGYGIVEHVDAPVELGRDDVLVVWGNAHWYPQAFRSLLRRPASERPFLVVWHSEPLPYPRSYGIPRQRLHAREVAKIVLRDPRATDPGTNARELRRLRAAGLPDLLVVSSRARADYLAEQGIEVPVVPLGWNSGLGEDRGLERDIDIYFLGALDPPRRRRMIRRLRRAGIPVQAGGAWDDERFWGESRTQLLNRTRILLNISRQPGQYAGERLLLGIANGALVISEPMARPEPFVPGEHFIETTIEEMPDAIRRYLADEEARVAIVRHAQAFVRREVTMTGSVSRILTLVEERREQARG